MLYGSETRCLGQNEIWILEITERAMVVVVVSSSHQSKSLCVSRFRSAQSISILLSV